MIVNQRSTFYLRLFLDLFILNFSFIVSTALAQPFPVLLSRAYMFVLLAVLNFVWYFFSNVVNFYEDFNTRLFAYQFINILKIIFVQILTAVLFIFITKEDLFTRNFILFYSLMLIVLISVRTEGIKYFLTRIRRKEKNIKNLIIVGAGEIGNNFRNMILTYGDFGYNFVGFLDNLSSVVGAESIIGSIADLDHILIEKEIDEVVIALPIFASTQLEDIIRVCNRHAVRVHIIPDYFRFVSKKYRISMIGNLPIITVRDEPLAETHWKFIKRTFDILFSILAIIFILSWLFPLLYILNKIYSPGSLLFIQDRIGAKNETFKCYKFRTMHADNYSIDKFVPTVEGDPRVTKIGRFLRKTNVDELPQFINVLKGDMSVVGPRPHTKVFNEMYSEMVDEIKLRSWVKPGITGWAQVNGLRGDVVDFEENKKRTKKRIEYDIWYIGNWSFWLDLQIIMLTIWQMIKRDTKGI